MVRKCLNASTSDPAMIPALEETGKISACVFIIIWNLGFWEHLIFTPVDALIITIHIVTGHVSNFYKF